MNKTFSNQSPSELDSRQVYDFLEQNPGFVAKHWNLFADFAPIGKGQGNVFLRKQIETLSQQQSAQDKTIQDILNITKSLERMQDMLTRFCNVLLGQGSSDDPPADVVKKLLSEEFQIECVVVFEESVRKDEKMACYDEIRQRVAHRSSICDDRVSKSLLKQIFDDDAKLVRSCAFIPVLQDDDISGVIVLGSADANRFHPDLGVLYLDRIGSLAGSYLSGKRQAVESTRR